MRQMADSIFVKRHNIVFKTMYRERWDEEADTVTDWKMKLKC